MLKQNETAEFNPKISFSSIFTDFVQFKHLMSLLLEGPRLDRLIANTKIYIDMDWRWLPIHYNECEYESDNEITQVFEYNQN